MVANGARRVALVTGANRGIGREIARQLAQRNIHVAIAARDGQQALSIADDFTAHGYSATGVQLDVTETDSIAATVDQVLNAHDRIDILINNAGISDDGQQPSKIDPALTLRVWHTNVLGAWQCANAVIPPMRKRGYGRIVNLSSVLGSLHHMQRPTEPAYRMSKAALNAVTRLLAAELADTGILVNSASPGWVRTDLGGPNALRTVEQGADTPVWLATLPDDGPTGGFFSDRQPMEW